MTGHLHAACASMAAGRGLRGAFSPPGTERKYERSRPFVVTHLALDVELDFAHKAVLGSARLDFKRMAPVGTELALDAVGLDVRRVLLTTEGGQTTELRADLSEAGKGYEYDGDTLSIPLAAAVTSGALLVEYRAVPQVGLYFLAPDDKVPDRPLQVWSQCQDEDARHWFPCQDKPHVKMTSEMRVTVPAAMTVLSGGRLVDRRPSGKGKVTFHYALDVPSPAYLTTLVAGTFDEWEEQVTLASGRVIPLRFLVPQGKLADGKRAFSGTARMIELFSHTTGVEYPWDRYSQVVVADFIFGGMENTTATTMYEHILLDKRAAIDIESHDLVAHELAHQWFGDLVTCRDWSHAWLNEGFATYFELVEKEARLGIDEYEEGVLQDLDAYLREARSSYVRPIVCRDYEEPIDLFDRHLYQKGGVVLHLLHKQLGSEPFWAGVHTYLERHRGSIVETTDLVRALEEASGSSLERFFDHWVYRPGHLELTLKLSYASGQLTIDVEQTQSGEGFATFDVPLEVDVTVGGVTTRHRRDLSERKGALVITTGSRPSLVALDPDFAIAAPIKLSGPQDLLRSMLEKAPRARQRKLAAQALAKRADPANIEALGAVLANESESWIVRNACAAALGTLRGQRSLELLVAVEGSPDARVRRAVAAALAAFADAKATAVLTARVADESYLVSAAAARALGRRHRTAAKKVLPRLLTKPSWADVVRSAALEGLALTGDEDLLDHLLEWSTYGKPLRARRAAIAALPRLAEGKRVREHLEELLDDRDPHTRSGVLSALEALGDARASGAISGLLETELDGRVRRRAKQALAALGKRGSAGLEEARGKAQKLEDEIAQLKVRLSKLEQGGKASDKAKAGATKKAATKSGEAKKAAAKRTAAKSGGAKKNASAQPARRSTPKQTASAQKKRTVARSRRKA